MIYTQEKPDKSEVLKREFLDVLTTFITQNKIPDSIVGIILDENFIKSNPSYYTYYPHLFNKVFKVNDEQILKSLTLSGFLYYRAVMLIDEMFDNMSSSAKTHFLSFLVSDICKEEAIKLLSECFSVSHPFWESWNKNKFQYAKAFEIDQVTHKINTYEDYEELADYKSAFGKVAIDALYHLSEEKDLVTYKNLLESHKFFYVAFQITDDISDFQEDLENGQFNIAIFELEKKIGKEKLKELTISELKKKLYLEGIIELLYEKALFYLKKASLCIEVYELEDWKHEIQKLNNAIVKNKLNIQGFIKVFHVKNKLSNKIQVSSSESEAIEKGKKFIINELEKETGCWSDFFNDKGISDVWTTGFILSQNFWNNKDVSFLNIDKILSFLTQEKKNNLWGYNTSWIEDADSSIYVMRTLLKHNKIENIIPEIYNYQHVDGGFKTYKNKEEVIASLGLNSNTDITGWLQSHFCVSAGAYLLFNELEVYNEQSKKLRNYLLSNLENEQSLDSYWWHSNIYALGLLYKGAILNKDNELLSLVLVHIWNYIEGKEYIKIKETNNYFYLGVLLEILSISNELDKYQKEKEEIISLLINNQLEDGSWKESEILQIPNPSVLNTRKQNIQWRVADKGTNIIITDFNRLFTTAVCLAGLHASREVKN